ncbi:MAG TPA: YCF48-related protein [Vicinamibacterales bacterium]|nr:YCF48-related protein [Vicinamibacterales bacterium]
MSRYRIGTVAVIAVGLLCQSPTVARHLFEQQPKPRGDTKFKAIFEPVNYSQDLRLHDVGFATDDIGWAVGDAGTILHSRDGGKTWTPQLGGDKENAAADVQHIRVLSEKVAFAAQPGGGDHALLRTTDGENWTQSGTVGQHRGDFEFTSADVGAYVSGDGIFHTVNAGKAWKEVYTCRLSLTIEGLARQVSCHFEDLNFPTLQVGYAISRVIGKTTFIIAKTTDGGATWTPWPVEMEYGGEHLYFLDDRRGFAKMWGGAVLRTDDGGKTWTAIAGLKLLGGKRARIDFADSEVGWGIENKTMAFTTDGGRRWTTRTLTFPTGVNAFSLPSRQRGYVVGDHGMVYRYRVVPTDYSVPGMIAAPMMPASAPK